MTKVLGKKALDIILAIFIVIIPIIVLFLSTNTLLIEKVVAVY